VGDYPPIPKSGGTYPSVTLLRRLCQCTHGVRVGAVSHWQRDCDYRVLRREWLTVVGVSAQVPAYRALCQQDGTCPPVPIVSTAAGTDL